ncbi:MAG: hypothetical protein HFE95_08350 [Acutalibacter sp.]|jgi:hypothetical protein|nr:hypothetical protein [Acutalibacter sp.]
MGIFQKLLKMEVVDNGERMDYTEKSARAFFSRAAARQRLAGKTAELLRCAA